MAHYDKLDIKPIWNVGYSPEFNPIGKCRPPLSLPLVLVEAVFAKVKAVFKRARLNVLVNKTVFNFDKEVRKAFDSITQEHCVACIRKSRHLLEKAA